MEHTPTHGTASKRPVSTYKTRTTLKNEQGSSPELQSSFGRKPKPFVPDNASPPTEIPRRTHKPDPRVEPDVTNGIVCCWCKRGNIHFVDEQDDNLFRCCRPDCHYSLHHREGCSGCPNGVSDEEELRGWVCYHCEEEARNGPPGLWEAMKRKPRAPMEDLVKLLAGKRPLRSRRAQMVGDGESQSFLSKIADNLRKRNQNQNGKIEKANCKKRTRIGGDDDMFSEIKMVEDELGDMENDETEQGTFDDCEGEGGMLDEEINSTSSSNDKEQDLPTESRPDSDYDSEATIYDTYEEDNNVEHIRHCRSPIARPNKKRKINVMDSFTLGTCSARTGKSSHAFGK
jgi:hypothetical protein